MPSDRWHVDLPFRGSRTYVHSTSICNHLRERFGPVARLELVMREWMDGRVLFAPIDGMTGAKATLRLDFADGTSKRFGLTDDKAHPVTTREPFDEDGLVAGAPLEDRVITVAANLAGTFFDRLISANKALINRSLDPGVRLIASKIVIERFPLDDQAFRLRLDSHLGTRIFRSSVLLGGDKIGEVVFYGQ
ncbi:hypothetical protein [Sphingomonas sp.]|jgi:hypothetical protein|uniref:hypothetical protein n=1 Tax=Sphingomonas sp. TaxID=28214 RepID=UPI0035C86D05